MTNVQVCPECGQLFEYGPSLGPIELCSTECRAERALGDAERKLEYQRDELGLRSVKESKR
jgi:hypothetical protein